MRIQQLSINCETKTKDNVFINVSVAVQYRVLVDGAYAAYYRLSDPRGQIQSYVFDVVRSTIPKMELDEAFASKDDIASAVFSSLQGVMQGYGYEITNTLITDMMPDAKVRASMNEINASKRLKEAAAHKAEAEKTRQVKAAEAEAEARYLSGVGVARQRKAIVDGLQSSVSEFSNQVEGATPKDVMSVLLLTQYLVRTINERAQVIALVSIRKAYCSFPSFTGYPQHCRCQHHLLGTRSCNRIQLASSHRGSLSTRCEQSFFCREMKR